MTRQCPPPGDFNPASERQEPAKPGPLSIFSVAAIADELGGPAFRPHDAPGGLRTTGEKLQWAYDSAVTKHVLYDMGPFYTDMWGIYMDIALLYGHSCRLITS